MRDLLGGAFRLPRIGSRRAFDPVAALAAGAAVLAVYDLSDPTTLFQDRAGTLPVTAPGQSVGVIRDKGPGGFHLVAPNDPSRGVYGVEAGGQGFVGFDGVDDSYATTAMAPAVDKAVVCLGLRKLSDAAVGTVFEYDTGGASVGFVSMRAPPGAASPNHGFAANGSIGLPFLQSPGAYAAPVTNVLTGLNDIAGDSTVIRVNGAQVASRATDQGAGNFGSHALFVGRRQAGTLPFNGRLYAMVLRFSAENLSPDLIARAERWVADRTGVTL